MPGDLGRRARRARSGRFGEDRDRGGTAAGMAALTRQLLFTALLKETSGLGVMRAAVFAAASTWLIRPAPDRRLGQ
jgi:hypothetical protein